MSKFAHWDLSITNLIHHMHLENMTHRNVTFSSSSSTTHVLGIHTGVPYLRTQKQSVSGNSPHLSPRRHVHNSSMKPKMGRNTVTRFITGDKYILSLGSYEKCVCSYQSFSSHTLLVVGCLCWTGFFEVGGSLPPECSPS